MAYLNPLTHQMAVKIVYYGPGLSGKTTNLKYIYKHLDHRSRGELICLETKTNRTFFFDLLPIHLGLIEGFRTHLHLYTIPGQIFYEASRRCVLKGVDGIVFVADSQIALLDANIESFDNLRQYLTEYGIDLFHIPLVFQYNKRDLKNIIPVETFNSLLNPKNFPYLEAVAVKGKGVFDSLREIVRVTLSLVKEKVKEEKDKLKGEKLGVTTHEVEVSLTQKLPPGEFEKEIDFIKEKKETALEPQIKEIRKVKLKNFYEITQELENLSRVYTGKTILKKKKREKHWEMSAENKKNFLEKLEKELIRAKRNKEKLLISVLDIDQFRKINNDLGWEYGDFVLSKVFEIIRENTRPYDLLVRYKDDEFIIILINTKKKPGIRIVQRIQKLMEEEGVNFGDISERITISAGVCLYPMKRDSEALELIRLANDALNRAKERGMSQIEIYS
ncbi:MAG: diguanylate cyclase [Candidatus Aminicenantia bacterium]